MFFLYNFIALKLVGGKFSSIDVPDNKSGPLKNTDLLKIGILYVLSQLSQESWVDPTTGLFNGIVALIDLGNNVG